MSGNNQWGARTEGDAMPEPESEKKLGMLYGTPWQVWVGEKIGEDRERGGGGGRRQAEVWKNYMGYR